jgi:dihydroneopterin aldolase
MTDTQRIKLELELEYINKAIEEFKLEDTHNYKKLKEYIKERENIEFRLWML